LKFSEIFGPHPGKLVKEASPELKKTPEEEEKLKEMLEEETDNVIQDEEEIFDSYKDSLEGSLYKLGCFDWASATQQKAPEVSADIPESRSEKETEDEGDEGEPEETDVSESEDERYTEEIGQSLVSTPDSRDFPLIHYSFTSPEFSATEQLLWEEEILWDDTTPDNENNGKTSIEYHILDIKICLIF